MLKCPNIAYGYHFPLDCQVILAVPCTIYIALNTVELIGLGNKTINYRIVILLINININHVTQTRFHTY